MTSPTWKILGIHHVTFRSKNLNESKKFYKEILGFNFLMEDKSIFIAQSGNVVLAVRGPESKTIENDQFDPFRIGLDHLAFGIESESEINRFADFLKEKNIWHVGPKTDPVLNKTYVAFKDADGIKLEFYLI